MGHPTAAICRGWPTRLSTLCYGRSDRDMSAGQYLRGALIEFTESFPIPIPNVILFQYNPETMTHTWTPAQTGGANTPGQTASNPLAITGPPEESFSFSISMDAGDMIADGSVVTAGLAEISGVYT